jgi:hypothetical protein
MSRFKDLEKEVGDLKKQIEELRAQVLTLAMRPPTFVSVPNPNLSLPVFPPVKISPIPSWPPYAPYIGDPPGGSITTISCKTQSFQNTQSSGIRDGRER